METMVKTTATFGEFINWWWTCGELASGESIDENIDKIMEAIKSTDFLFKDDECITDMDFIKSLILENKDVEIELECENEDYPIIYFTMNNVKYYTQTCEQFTK